MWLGWRLGFRKMRDWYRLAYKDMAQSHGLTPRRDYWRSTPVAAVKECFPQYEWHEWLFVHVPTGFWDSSGNRRRYMRWLGQQLGFRRPQDWYAIRQDDFEAHHGARILQRFRSMYDLLAEYLPQLDWTPFRRGGPMSIARILKWADAHFAEHGEWPTVCSGTIPGSSDNWQKVENGLRFGFRGLPGGSSLAKVLEEHRGVTPGRVEPLEESQILKWADAYYGCHGRWPTSKSGIVLSNGEKEITWLRIDSALRRGERGLPGGDSLARFLSRCRRVQNRTCLRRLSEREILAWATEHFQATGRWPTSQSGAVAQLPGTSWSGIHQALRNGSRGLPGGSTLSKVLKKHGLRSRSK